MLIIFSLVSLVFSEDLTKDQLEQIKEATEDLYRAPNFSLQSTNDSLYVLEDMTFLPTETTKVWLIRPLLFLLKAITSSFRINCFTILFISFNSKDFLDKHHQQYTY